MPLFTNVLPLEMVDRRRMPIWAVPVPPIDDGLGDDHRPNHPSARLATGYSLVNGGIITTRLA